MWQKFTLLFLTPVTLHPVCRLRRVRPCWRNDLWQWPEASVEQLSSHTLRGWEIWRCASRLSSQSESLGRVSECVCPSVCVCVCVPMQQLSLLSAAWKHCGPPRSAALLSPRLSGRKVLMAAATPRLPEHLLRVTLLPHCHLTPSDSGGTNPCYFTFSKPEPDGSVSRWMIHAAEVWTAACQRVPAQL